MGTTATVVLLRTVNVADNTQTTIAGPCPIAAFRACAASASVPEMAATGMTACYWDSGCAPAVVRLQSGDTAGPARAVGQPVPNRVGLSPARVTEWLVSTPTHPAESRRRGRNRLDINGRDRLDNRRGRMDPHLHRRRSHHPNHRQGLAPQHPPPSDHPSDPRARDRTSTPTTRLSSAPPQPATPNPPPQTRADTPNSGS
jgi:hypothetical protein